MRSDGRARACDPQARLHRSRDLERALHQARAIALTREQAEVVGRFLYEDLGFQADPKDTEGSILENLLLSSVIRRRRGICRAIRRHLP